MENNTIMPVCCHTRITSSFAKSLDEFFKNKITKKKRSLRQKKFTNILTRKICITVKFNKFIFNNHDNTNTCYSYNSRK